MQVEYSDIISDFKKKDYKPIYFLCGEETYFIDELAILAESTIIPEESKEFSQYILYGKDISIKELSDLVRQKTFFGGNKFILLREAQEIKDKEWENFIPLIDHFPEENILIICYKNKKPDGRLAWSKKVKEKTSYFESKPLKEFQLTKFINDLCQEESVKIQNEANQALIDMVGANLKQLKNEVSKLAIGKEAKQLITVEEVMDAIGVSREFNAFEYQKALTIKDYSKLYFIAQNMQKQLKNTPLLLIIGSLYSYFSKLWIVKSNLHRSDKEISELIQLPFIGLIKEYREVAAKYSIEEIHNSFSILKKFDLKSKGINAVRINEEELFMEMTLGFIYSIKDRIQR
ncbi:MAG: DNA polymerase III subunit delta [Saprospiraceae bacterium]|nr:DNA polymerase III subunit delta [Saprospiraceae bacterium]